MWQECPICKGTGLDPTYRVFNDSPPKCPTCNGKRIINELTGKPPFEINIDKNKIIKTKLNNLNESI